MKCEFKKIGVVLISLVILLTAFLVVEVFKYSETESTVEFFGGDLISSEQTSLVLKPGMGVQDDLQSRVGPWWITNNLAQLVVENPTANSQRLSFELVFMLGVCNTGREIVVTVNNQSSSFFISPTKPMKKQLFNIDSKPNSFTYIVLQVDGPACQGSDDPRIFFGQVSISEFVLLES